MPLTSTTAHDPPLTTLYGCIVLALQQKTTEANHPEAAENDMQTGDYTKVSQTVSWTDRQ